MLTIQNIHSLYKKHIVNDWRIAKVLTQPTFYHIEIMNSYGDRFHIALERNVRSDGFYPIKSNSSEMLIKLSSLKTMDSFIEVLKRLIK